MMITDLLHMIRNRQIRLTSPLAVAIAPDGEVVERGEAFDLTLDITGRFPVMNYWVTITIDPS